MKTPTWTTWLAIAAIGWCALAGAQPAPRDAASGTVSIDRQLRLKRKLLMGQDSSLAAVMRANRQAWERATPEQREVLRQRAYALRQADPRQRDTILDAWGAFSRLDEQQKQQYRQRAVWLRAVVATLTEQERAELLKMPAADRARELLQLKSQMQAEGLLALDSPAERDFNDLSPEGLPDEDADLPPDGILQ
jgi:hypothetical protein